MNLLLVRVGFPPAIIYTRDRSRYLTALRRADGGEPGPLGEMIARAVLDNLYRFVMPAVAGPRRLVPLAALADKDHSVSTLRAAAEGGDSEPSEVQMVNGETARGGSMNTEQASTSGANDGPDTV